MRFIYQLLISLTQALLPISSLFSNKMKLFVNGRKKVTSILAKKIEATDQVIWFHCASLGEFEQGLPVIETLKEKHPTYKIVVSFFSPSGYENIRESKFVDVKIYLPLDTKKNAKRFLKQLNPKIAVFVKYDFWPNYLFELQRLQVPTFLISALFRENQVFFKPYGSFMKRALNSFTHIFVQDENSINLLKKVKIYQASISGDTRFDRVKKQAETCLPLEYIEQFKDNQLCFVAGSTWPEDEELLLNFINKTEIKVVIAPHNISKKTILTLQKNITQKTVLFSNYNAQDMKEARVFILDTIGVLKHAYAYCDIAYIGGAVGTTGLHNILEAATFGVPIITGNKIENFPEAKMLAIQNGLFPIATKNEFEKIIFTLIKDKSFRKEKGSINKNYILTNTGATQKIVTKIEPFLNNV